MALGSCHVQPLTGPTGTDKIHVIAGTLKQHMPMAAAWVDGMDAINILQLMRRSLPAAAGLESRKGRRPSRGPGSIWNRAIGELRAIGSQPHGTQLEGAGDGSYGAALMTVNGRPSGPRPGQLLLCTHHERRQLPMHSPSPCSRHRRHLCTIELVTCRASQPSPMGPASHIRAQWSPVNRDALAEHLLCRLQSLASLP